MKGFSVALIAFGLFAAGCVTPDTATTASLEGGLAGATTTSVLHRASGALAEPSDGLARALGGQYWIGVPSAEPTIAVTSDGTLFMTGNVKNPSCGLAGGCPVLPYANFNAGPTIMRSSDKGLTWEDAYPKLPTGDSEKARTWDPYVFVDPATDRVFMDDIYPISCGSIAWTDDLGASWTRNPYSCGNPQVNDHQTLVAAKPRSLPTVGYDNLIYRCVNNLMYVGCAISQNGGLTFSPQVPIASTIGECSAITGHLEADLEGRVYIGLPCSNLPGVAMTEDDGVTWTLSYVSDSLKLASGTHDIDLATDEAGNVYAFFLSGTLPYLSFSTDHGASWSEPRMVGAPGVTFTKFNAIAAGAPGHVAFAYVGTTHPGGPEPECGALPALPCTDPEEWNDATWNAYIGVMTDALGDDPVIQSVTANDPADPIARAACADRCHGMTDFIDITIDAEGRPWASFVDVCIAECVSDPSVFFDGNSGFAATLREGPALRGDVGRMLATLPPAIRN